MPTTADEPLAAPGTQGFVIPDALLATGLFRRTWTPGHDAPNAPDGNIFIRDEEQKTVNEPLDPTTPGPAAGGDDGAPEVYDPFEAFNAPAAESNETELTGALPVPPVLPNLTEASDADSEPASASDDASDGAAEKDPTDPWGNLNFKVAEPSNDVAPADPWATFGSPEPESLTEDDTENAAVPLSPIAAAAAAASASQAAGSADALEQTVVAQRFSDLVPQDDATDAPEATDSPEESADAEDGDDVTAEADTSDADSAEEEIDAFAAPIAFGAGAVGGLAAGAAAAAVPPAPASSAVIPPAAPSAPADPFADAFPTRQTYSSTALPSSVPFAPGAEELDDQGPAAPVKEKKSRKGLLAAVLAIALVVGVSGFFWWNHQKDAPVRDAFNTSHGKFMVASTKMKTASSIEEVAAAGRDYMDALDSINATSEITRDNASDVSVAARRASLAESNVAAAAAPLANLEATDVSAWSTTKQQFASTLDELGKVRGDIETAGGDTSNLPDASLADHVQSVISTELVTGASTSVAEIASRLESAALLADIRAVGSTSKEYIAPLKASLPNVSGDEAEELAGIIDFYESLSGFSQIRTTTFDQWDGLHTKAVASAEKLTTNSDEALSGLEAADALVTKADSTWTKWQTKFDAKQKEKSERLAALTAAESAVTSASSTYATLVAETNTIVGSAASLNGDGRDSEAFRRMDAVAGKWEALAETLTDENLTPRPKRAVQELLDVITSNADDTRAAADAAAACAKRCKIETRPTWRTLEGKIASRDEDWTLAVEDFTTAAEASRENIAVMKMPKRPKI